MKKPSCGLSSPACCLGCVLQDEMKALQRLNTLFFLVGYLGFVAVWITDLILSFLPVGHVMDVMLLEASC